MSSSTTHNILILVKQQGLDQTTTAIKGLATTSQTATKSTDALGSSWARNQQGAVKLGSGVQKLDKAEQNTNKTTQNYTKTTNTAGKATSGFAAKFQGNKGLIFAFTGIAASGGEAVGMLGMWQDANTKVAEAQDRVNMLVNAGVTSGKALTDAESDLTDAKRGLSFATRILALSFGDLVPFVLLSINSIIKLKDTIMQGKSAIDTGAAAITGLGNATANAAKGGLTQVLNSAGQVVGGMKNLDTSFRNTTTTSGQLLNSQGQLVTGLGNVGRSAQENTKFIGNRSSGLVGGFDALTLGMDQSEKKSKTFSGAFSSLGNSIKSLPTVFRAAGTAVMGFGKALLGLALNPIGLAIMGVSAAVLALASDFGGIRTALNSVGSAIGSAIPQLKGLLDWFGQAVNGALDAVAGFLGFDTAAQKSALAAEEAKKKMDPLLLSLQKYIDLGSQFSKLNQIVNLFAGLRSEIDKVTTQVNFMGQSSIKNLTSVGNAATTLFATFKEKTPQAQTAIQHFYDVLRLLETGQLDASKASEYLNLALDAVGNSMGKSVTETQKDITSKQKNTQETTKVQNATLGLSKELVSLSTNWQIATAEGKNMSAGVSENEKLVTEYMKSIGKTIPPVNELTGAKATLYQTMLNNAPLLEKYAKNMTYNADGTLNWDLTVRSLTKTHQAFANQTAQDWAKVKSYLSQGVQGYELAKSHVELLKASDEERGAAVEKLLEQEVEKLGQVVDWTEKAKQYTDEWKASIDKITSSFEAFASKGTSTLSSVGQKLLDIAAKAREASEEYINGEGKRKERKEAFHDTMMKLYDEETQAIGNMSVATARSAVKWAEYEKASTDAVNNFAASALTGHFPAAIKSIDTALDNTPAKWKGASGQLEQVLNNTALTARDKANLISADMTMLENAMKPVQVGAEFVGKAGAEAAAGLDELAAAALENVNPLTQMDDAWKKFTASLSPTQQQLGLVQAVMKSVENGSMTAAKGFQILEAAGVKASQQIGSTVTTSLANLEHQIINLGNGTQATVAKMDGQWVNLGTSTAKNLGPSGAQGNVMNLENEMTNLGTTATSQLGTQVPGAMSTTATTANTQFNKVVNYANLVIEVFKAVSTYAKQYLSQGVKTSIDAMVKAIGSAETKVKTFGDAAKKSFDKTGESAKQAERQVQALKKAIDSLKNKTVTITQKFTTSGTRYVRQGGSFISMDPTGFAASGKSWVNSKPRKIGGMNISEFGKPELVTVTPLSNPFDPTDKNISIGTGSKPQPIPSTSKIGANPFKGSGGSSGQGQPIQVTGNLYVTVRTQNGKVLAQEVQPYLLDGFSGVT